MTTDCLSYVRQSGRTVLDVVVLLAAFGIIPAVVFVHLAGRGTLHSVVDSNLPPTPAQFLILKIPIIFSFAQPFFFLNREVFYSK